MIKAIVGANWGDEGKGKITDALAENADVVIRFQGGSNAGHTIVNEYGKFAMHQLPSGVFNARVTNVIGSGVALSVENFKSEMDMLCERGVPTPNVMISDRAQVVMPYHKLLDAYEEQRLSDKSFGSTRSGIAPFYSDKYAKIGFQVNELYADDEYLSEKAERVCTLKNVLLEHLYRKPLLTAEEIVATVKEYREILRPYVADTFSFLYDANRQGKTILLEGQLGSLRDIDFGIYPMTTSSNTIAAYGAVGAGLPSGDITSVIAVVKAYSSAVGAGEFVSEITGPEADELRDRGGDGGEYGATTGRPRRMGWLDLVASRYGVRVQSATEVALTVVDALSYLKEIPVCVAYNIDGVETRRFPTTVELKRAKPVFKTFKGWGCDIRGIRKYSELPAECRAYIEFAEEFIGAPITMVSNGPRREDIIYR